MPAPAGGEFQTMPAPAAEQQIWNPPGQEGQPGLGERFGESMGRNYIEDNGIMPNVGEPRISASEGPLHAQSADSTMTSGVSFTGGGSGSESVLGGSTPESAVEHPGQGDNGTRSTPTPPRPVSRVPRTCRPCRTPTASRRPARPPAE